MITCIYDYISKKKCIKCMILMHEIACYQRDNNAYSSSLESLLDSLISCTFNDLIASTKVIESRSPIDRRRVAQEIASASRTLEALIVEAS